MQHILVHSKMNGLRPLLTAPPVFAFRQLRGDSKKCCRLLHYKSNYQSCTNRTAYAADYQQGSQKNQEKSQHKDNKTAVRAAFT